MEIFAVKWNVVSETSKVQLNDIFTKLDESSGIRNIITFRLNLGVCKLQVDDIPAKIRYGREYKEIYQSGKSSFKWMFFQYFQWEMWEGDSNSFSTIDHACTKVAARFYEFHFIVEEQNS